MKDANYISTSELAKILGISRVRAFQMFKKVSPEKHVKRGKTLFVQIEDLPEDVQERLRRSQAEGVEIARKLVEKPEKDIPFEKQLWEAADKLRGNVDASEYKHIVLGLLFLKYTSDAFYARYAELERRTQDKADKAYFMPTAEGRQAILEDKDQYRSANVFYIPEDSRWEFLRQKAMRPEIGESLDEAMEAMEKENPKLKGVLPKIFKRTPIDAHVLGELVNILSRINFDHDIDKEKDMLGRVYEYFIGMFATSEGKRGGEFYTPSSIVRTLVEILEPFENSRIFDPACGSGGMFVQSSRFMKMHQKDSNRLAFYGQESNLTTWRLCRMNLAIRGINSEHIQCGDSYNDDKFPDLRADFVLANPPFNADWDPGRLPQNDPRIKYGLPPSGNANFMWIQHFLYHLAPNGMAGFVMANGALAVGGKEGEIRAKMVEADLADVIIACPPKLFYNVGLPVSLWFVTKNKTKGRFRDRRGETLFIDARELFEPLSRKQVVFTEAHVAKIADAVRAWRGQGGEYKDEVGFCKSVTKDEIAKNNHVLTPGRYVGVREEEDDGVPFEEKMRTFGAELKSLFAESRKLEGEIEKNLKTLGY